MERGARESHTAMAVCMNTLVTKIMHRAQARVVGLRNIHVSYYTRV